MGMSIVSCPGTGDGNITAVRTTILPTSRTETRTVDPLDGGRRGDEKADIPLQRPKEIRSVGDEIGMADDLYHDGHQRSKASFVTRDDNMTMALTPEATMG